MLIVTPAVPDRKWISPKFVGVFQSGQGHTEASVSQDKTLAQVIRWRELPGLRSATVFSQNAFRGPAWLGYNRQS
jgi:hypothetical protein